MPLPFERQPDRRHTPAIIAARGLVDRAALFSLVLGGLNYGLMAVADFDAVAAVFGEGTNLAHAVQLAYGAAAVRCLFILLRPGGI